MTIALGILCKGGAVLAADSQETVQGYWKRRQSKIQASNLGPDEDLAIVMAGAGRAGYVDALIESLIGKAVPASGKWHHTLEVIRAGLISFHNDHVVPYQHDPPETPLVIAMQKGRHLASLFVTDRSTMTETHRFAAVGIGSAHALGILQRALSGVSDHRLPVDAAVALAGYVIHHTKRNVADCGDVTNIVIIQRGSTGFISDSAISEMDVEFSRFFEAMEPSILGMLLGIKNVAGSKLALRISSARKIIARAAHKRHVTSGVEEVTGSVPRDDE